MQRPIAPIGSRAPLRKSGDRPRHRLVPPLRRRFRGGADIAWSYEKAAVWFLAVAGTITVYALSIGVVDAFQDSVTALTTHATFVSLAKQTQVGLSITWAALGGATFIAGATRRWAALRFGALALLGVATVKVFLLDLASLDATYRVPSFIGLGILLLASSYFYQRLKPGAAAKTVS